MNKSAHAIIRGQQRGFRKDHVDLIIGFGTPIRRPGNTFEYRIGGKDRKRIIQHLDKIKQKAVLVDGKTDNIITMYNLK